MLSAVEMESTYALTVLHKLDYKVSQILKTGSFLQTQVLMVNKVMVISFLGLLCITSWKTLSLPYKA